MNPAPSLQGALWNGNQQLATKRQLLSSINGVYADLQDLSGFNFQTLTASTFNGSFVSLSTLQLKALDIGGIDFSFDLGLGDALGGALAGLGAAVGGAFVGVGTGVGLAVQGLETGLATLITGRGDNFINNTTFETINTTTQLQISTLGNDFPLYSSIFRSVSSVNPNVVPGQQIFTSTFFLPGTTCIRSVSDPLSIITGDSNIVTSTIQSFGQWIPFIDPTPAGEDIFARDAQFSTLVVSSSNNSNVGNGVVAISNVENPFNPTTLSLYAKSPNISNVYNVPYSEGELAQVTSNTSLLNFTAFDMNLNFISTPYLQYSSTIGTYGTPVYFINSSITQNLSTIPLFTYTGLDFGGANFAVCEPDETGFLSTGTMDLVAQSSNITFQWGLAVNNFNSTIAVGTSKRVSWDIPNNTSNFIDIPVPQSTIVGGRSNAYALLMKPNELEFIVQDQTPFYQGFPYRPIAFNINGACFGSNTAWSNQPGYPYQFNNNLFVNGIIEADSIIATSSIVNVSTNIQTFFSTQTFDADEATISSLVVTSLITAPNIAFSNANVSSLNVTYLNASNANVSSLQTNFIGGDSISSFGIEIYNSLSQFSYVSTLVVDFQILEGVNGGTTTNLNKIQANTGGSFVRNFTLGSFSNLSTNNLSTGSLVALNANIVNPTFSTINLSTIQEIGLTNIFNYPGAITAIAGNNTAPVVGIGFKAQLSTNTDNQIRVDYNWNGMTGTSNGSVFYPFATFDTTNPVPYVWDINNVGNAVMSNATIDNAFISTLVLSSIVASSASYSNLVVSTINNENSSTLLQYLSMPNSDGATQGSPGVWLQWIDLNGIRPNIRACPSLDLNIGCIAVGADNPPNGGMTGYIGVREKGAGSPITYKVLENRTIYAGSGTPALYGGDITFALQRDIDYSVNASTMTIWILGAANNPYFRTGGYASNAFIRGYPY